MLHQIFSRMLVILSVFVPSAHASLTSYHVLHPVGFMHALPVGETPGWSTPVWFNFEVSHGNIWNKQINMVNRGSGATLTYGADFEQTVYIAEIGTAFTDWLAFALEVPYISRDGGFLDGFLDDFHKSVNSERFLRDENPENRNNFTLKENGRDLLSTAQGSGFGYIKTKWKLWLAGSKPSGKENCACGLAIGYQTKFPLDDSREGISSGNVDHSLSLYLGSNFNQDSAVWLTAAVTSTPHNQYLDDFPLRRWHQMYEASFDFGLGGNWGLVFQGRTESPIMNRSALRIQDSSPLYTQRVLNRIASGWNSLVHWRGSESLGIRYRYPQGDRIQFLIVEDWGLGDLDELGGSVYVNNAPDVAFTLQLHLGF